jgi:nitroreductase
VEAVDAIAECLNAAAAAPSIHNSQPWQFRLRGGGIDVLSDPERQLPVVDPSGRQLLISVGAALFNLRVALLAHGRVPVVRLWPDPAQPRYAARVVLGSPVVAGVTARALANAVGRRRTNRLPFTSRAIPRPALDDLVRAAGAEGATLTVAGPVDRDLILDLTRAANDRQQPDAGYRVELAAWTQGSPSRRDGVPARAWGPTDRWHGVPLRDFGLAVSGADRCVPSFEPRPTLLVLSTQGDSPYRWIRAGQALERVLLTATVRGLAATPLGQCLELSDLRSLVPVGRADLKAQIILRIGYGYRVPSTPRRPLSEVVLTDEAASRRAERPVRTGPNGTPPECPADLPTHRRR